MHYTDNLVYHYVGGIALAALKMWPLAQDFFETCVTSPGLVPSAIQFEALKKMRLVQLIDKGRVEPLPKYALPNLTRLIKNSPYQVFVNAYPHDVEGLKEIVKKEKQVFMTDRNFGLVQQAIERAPRWTIKKLIGTYVTLNLTDIARAVKIESLDQVREILLNMVYGIPRLYEPCGYSLISTIRFYRSSLMKYQPELPQMEQSHFPIHLPRSPNPKWTRSYDKYKYNP